MPKPKLTPGDRFAPPKWLYHDEFAQDLDTARNWLQTQLQASMTKLLPPTKYPEHWNGKQFSSVDAWTRKNAYDAQQLQALELQRPFVKAASEWLKARYPKLLRLLNNNQWDARIDYHIYYCLFWGGTFSIFSEPSVALGPIAIASFKTDQIIEGGQPVQVTTPGWRSFGVGTLGMLVLYEPDVTRGELLERVRRELVKINYEPKHTARRPDRHRPVDIKRHLSMYQLWKDWARSERTNGRKPLRQKFYAGVLLNAELRAGRVQDSPENHASAIDASDVWADPQSVNDLSTVRKALTAAERLCAPRNVGELSTFLASVPGPNTLG